MRLGLGLGLRAGWAGPGDAQSGVESEVGECEEGDEVACHRGDVLRVVMVHFPAGGFGFLYLLCGESEERRKRKSR